MFLLWLLFWFLMRLVFLCRFLFSTMRCNFIFLTLALVYMFLLHDFMVVADSSFSTKFTIYTYWAVFADVADVTIVNIVIIKVIMVFNRHVRF